MPHKTMMENHKEKLENFCKATFINEENKGNKTITRAKDNQAVE